MDKRRWLQLSMNVVGTEIIVHGARGHFQIHSLTFLLSAQDEQTILELISPVSTVHYIKNSFLMVTEQTCVRERVHNHLRIVENLCFPDIL